MITAMTARAAPKTIWSGLTAGVNSEEVKSFGEVMAFALIGLALSLVVFVNASESLIFANF